MASDFGSRRHSAPGLASFLSVLVTRRSLLWELVLRDLRDAYQGSAFSKWWAILHPLLIIALYLFVFGHVFSPRLGGTIPDVPDFAVFLLSGLAAWLTVQAALMKSATSLTGSANLVKQVVFPIELLPVRAVLAAQVPLLIGIVVLIVYSAVRFGLVSPLLPLVIVVLLLQTMLLIGMGLLFAALTVFLRDVRDVLQIFVTIGLFLAPILYVPDSLPAWFETVMFFNPFSYAIWCFQDIFFFQAIVHPSAWLALTIGSVVSLLVGVMFFERTRQHFGDAL